MEEKSADYRILGMKFLLNTLDPGHAAVFFSPKVHVSGKPCTRAIILLVKRGIPSKPAPAHFKKTKALLLYKSYGKNEFRWVNKNLYADSRGVFMEEKSAD